MHMYVKMLDINMNQRKWLWMYEYVYGLLCYEWKVQFTKHRSLQRYNIVPVLYLNVNAVQNISCALLLSFFI